MMSLLSSRGHSGFAGWLTQMGVPAPQFMAYSVASIEAGGGYLFAAGLFPYFTCKCGARVVL